MKTGYTGNGAQFTPDNPAGTIRFDNQWVRLS